MKTAALKQTTLWLVVLSLPIALSACAGLGNWQDILQDAAGGYGGDRIQGEVEYVDGQRREIGVRSGWSGTERVRYDSGTRVTYQNRRYDVRDLERGDRVSVWLESDRNRELYAREIRVDDSRYDRRDDRDDRYGVQRLDGRVRYVDDREYTFQVETSRDGLVTVYLDREPSRSTRDQFRRLRRGDRIRFEGEWVGQRSMVLRRFR